MPDPSPWAAATPGLVIAALGALTSITISLINPWLSRKNKLKEQSWDRKQEAYSVIIVSLEACRSASIRAGIVEKLDPQLSNLEDMQTLQKQSLADVTELYLKHNEIYSVRRFIVSRNFAKCHTELVENLGRGMGDLSLPISLASHLHVYLPKLVSIAEQELIV